MGDDYHAVLLRCCCCFWVLALQLIDAQFFLGVFGGFLVLSFGLLLTHVFAVFVLLLVVRCVVLDVVV